jgi:hypothetical protein
MRKVDSSFHPGHEISKPEVDSELSRNTALSHDSQSELSGSFIASEGTPSFAPYSPTSIL